MTLTTHEIEWQFDVTDLRIAETWLRTRARQGDLQFHFAGAEPQIDAYFDSTDWRFFRAGFALRHRAVEGRSEATLKSFGDAQGAQLTRREINERMEGNDLPKNAPRDAARWLMRAPGDVGSRVRTVLGKQRLHKLFEVRTVRQRITLRLEGELIAEVALDDVSIASPRHRTPLRLNRVEIEIRADAPAPVQVLGTFVEEFRRACRLMPATQSKFEAGLRAYGAQPGYRADLGTPATVADIGTDPSISTLAFAVLREHFAQFIQREPGARLGEDPEEVHRMRVATRKMRAAMSLFRDYLPQDSIHLRNEIGWIANALGGVRDLDVQLERAKAWHADDGSLDADALRSLEQLLHTLREPARDRLLRAFNSSRYAVLLKDMSALLRDGPSPDYANRSARTEMPALILRRYVKIREGGDVIDDDSPAEELHELRIQCKRLRYALEFAAPLYPKAIKNFLPRLIELQDVLGEHQDAYVAIEQMRALSVARGSELPAHTIESLNEISQRYASRALELRDQFAKLYRKLKGKAWQQVQRALDA